MRREMFFIKYVQKYIHRMIVWYLKRCGGAFHSGSYGRDGKYVALMSDEKFHHYQNIK